MAAQVGKIAGLKGKEGGALIGCAMWQSADQEANKIIEAKRVQGEYPA